MSRARALWSYAAILAILALLALCFAAAILGWRAESPRYRQCVEAGGVLVKTTDIRFICLDASVVLGASREGGGR